MYSLKSYCYTFNDVNFKKNCAHSKTLEWTFKGVLLIIVNTGKHTSTDEPSNTLSGPKEVNHTQDWKEAI